MHLNETLFYVFGIGLAVSAVVVSFLGLKVKSFPGKAFPLVVVWFAIFVVGATTFSVLHAQDEEKAKAAETVPAGEEFEEEEADVEAAEADGALHIAAEATALAYDTTELTAEAGKVTIDFDNPSAITHDVAIEQDGKEIAATELITEGEDSLSAELKPGTYTFLCTVPGHAVAGMEGKLVVQ